MNHKSRENKIHIGKREGRQYNIYSGALFFDNLEYCVIKFDGTRITIQKCGLNIPKNAIKVVREEPNYYCRLRLTESNFEFELPIGNFLFDEESTEDCVVLYFGEE